MERLRKFLNLPLWWFEDDDAEDAAETSEENTEEESEETSETSLDAEDSEKKRIYDEEVEDALKTLDEIEDVEAEDPDTLKALLKRTNKAMKVLANSNEKLSNLARTRLHEIMEKKQKLRDIADKDEQLRLDEMKKKEEFKKALDEIEPRYDILKKDVAKTQAFFVQQFEELKASLPDEFQGLIPEGDIRDKIAWIQKFTKTVVKSATATGSSGKGDETTEESAEKKKANVGGEGSPPGGTPGRPDAASIEQAMNECQNEAELEELLADLQAKGVR